MSGYLPVGTTLTLGDASGNITYTGTVSSPNITTMTANIATNRNNIVTNSTNIATNTSNIVTNSTNIATNTSNIVTNSTNIVTNSTNIATNVTDINVLKVKQTNVIQVYASPAIFADARPPASVPTASSNSFAQFGWYFKNSFSSGSNKINWYFPPNTGMIVSDIIGLYMRYFNISTTSNDNSPFLTIYTKPTGTGDAFPGFFHSSMTYVINTTPVINTNFVMFENVTGNCPSPSSYASTIQTMIQSTVNNPRGPYLPTEQILAIVISTNSASPVNSVEFIAQKLGLMTINGTQEFLLQNLL